jgi:ADP-heptose:LPS heptosyltransferase
MVSQLLELRRRRFDVVMNFVFNQTTIPGIRANLIAPDAVKIGQGPDKYAFYFNRLVKVPRFERHMTEQLAVFVESAFGFQLAPDELQLGIDVPDEQQAKVDTWLREHSLVRNADPATYGLPYAVFNLSVRESDRGLSEEQAAGVCALLCRSGRFRTVVMFDPQNSQAAAMVAARPEFKSSIVFRTDGTSPLLQIASLIGGAIAVVTPDTSVIHFASAMQTPVCGIYGQDYKGVEWGPFRVRHKIIRAEAEGPTSSISVGELTNEVDGFVEDILSDERRR